MKIKNRCILLAVVLNFTNFSNFVQEKRIIFATPTAIYRIFYTYIGVLAFRSRYIYLHFSN